MSICPVESPSIGRESIVFMQSEPLIPLRRCIQRCFKRHKRFRSCRPWVMTNRQLRAFFDLHRSELISTVDCCALIALYIDSQHADIVTAAELDEVSCECCSNAAMQPVPVMFRPQLQLMCHTQWNRQARARYGMKREPGYWLLRFVSTDDRRLQSLSGRKSLQKATMQSRVATALLPWVDALL
jgi:hypothetical protein